jgi:hypothetical protein
MKKGVGEREKNFIYRIITPFPEVTHDPSTVK